MFLTCWWRLMSFTNAWSKLVSFKVVKTVQQLNFGLHRCLLMHSRSCIVQMDLPNPKPTQPGLSLTRCITSTYPCLAFIIIAVVWLKRSWGHISHCYDFWYLLCYFCYFFYFLRMRFSALVQSMCSVFSCCQYITQYNYKFYILKKWDG